MCLAMAVGRGDSPLARLSGATPPVRAEDTVLIGRRDVGQPGCGSDVLRAFGVLDIPHAAVQEGGTAAAVSTALERVERTDIDGIWIHVDADVLDPRVMPAVDSPEPGGPGIEDLAALARPLVKHGRALGMQVTIYDPALDRERKCAERIVGFLESVLAEIPE
jgi:arginase